MYLSYLPLAHIFDRVIEELFVSKGASIGFWHKVSFGKQKKNKVDTLEMVQNLMLLSGFIRI